MKKILFITVSILLLSCGSEVQRPNIMLFFVDDLGWQDTSVPLWDKPTHLNRTYHTPNMERLAQEGMKFTQAYATSVCSPTRVSLMTGMNAARHRVTNWTLHKDMIQPMEANHPDLNFPKWNVNGLTSDPSIQNAVHATTLPAILQKNGYQTIHVGKAHFGAIGTPAADPKNIGFDVNIAGHAAGGPGGYHGEKNFSAEWRGGANTWDVPGLEKYHGTQINLTEALTLEALLALEDVAKTDKPFFLYMSHYTVHTPIESDDQFLQKYKGLHPTEAKYASMIEGMDKSLGDIMNYIEKHDLEENTIILFMSDNGGLSAVARGGEKHTHNWPLSSGKGSVREGGIREPMIVKWPGVVAAESISNDYLIIEDFFPTLLSMAGIHNYETVQSIDGKSFVSMLKQTGTTSTDRSLVWHYPNEWGPSGPGIGAASAIRKDDWKLIYYHLDQRFELFNLENDISESKNLANVNPKMLNELAEALTDYLIEVKAQMPSSKTTGIQIPYPAEALSYLRKSNPS